THDSSYAAHTSEQLATLEASEKQCDHSGPHTPSTQPPVSRTVSTYHTSHAWPQVPQLRSSVSRSAPPQGKTGGVGRSGMDASSSAAASSQSWQGGRLRQPTSRSSIRVSEEDVRVCM